MSSLGVYRDPIEGSGAGVEDLESRADHFSVVTMAGMRATGRCGVSAAW